MRNIKNGLLGLVAIIIIYFAYGAWVSLPEFDIKAAHSAKALLERNINSINKEKKNLELLKESSEWAFLEPYAKQRKWSEKIEEAVGKIKAAESLYQDTIEPILDKNHEEDLKALKEAVSKVRSIGNKGLALAKIPANEVKVIFEGKSNKEKYYQTATSTLKKAKAAVNDFKSSAINATSKYPKKEKLIQSKAESIEQLLAMQVASVSKLITEYESASPNFFLYSSAFENSKKQYTVLDKQLNNEKVALQGLDKSYVKILSDQKVDYSVIVGRANWCENDGCYNGSQMLYPAVKVDADTASYFDKSKINTIAKNTRRWRSNNFKLYIPKNRWDALGIDKYYRWNRREPYAEYWIDSIKEKTYHRYSIIENGKVTQTSWKEVPNNYFWKHFDNLGMALVTKPLGFFEDEAITTAEPVGLATIAEPVMVDGVATGSNRYGEWRQDSSGSSFWFYYSIYRMFGDFVPGRYGYNEWHGYSQRKRSQPYYGTSGQYGTFGKSTYKNSRYKNSTFSKRNPKAVAGAITGKRSRTASSVRGAGITSRGKGPSRSGK